MSFNISSATGHELRLKMVYSSYTARQNQNSIDNFSHV